MITVSTEAVKAAWNREANIAVMPSDRNLHFVDVAGPNDRELVEWLLMLRELHRNAPFGADRIFSLSSTAVFPTIPTVARFG
jgi:hypothetical protein